ncbi:MAG: hypothetical protein ABI388_12180 [Bacteroidia bacterium]
MKKIIRLSVFSLFLLNLCAFTKADTWYLLESKAFGFTIEFPKKPTEQIQTVDSEIGKLTLNLFIYDASAVKTESNLVYLVNCTLYPDSLIDSDDTDKLGTVYRQAIDGAVANVKGKLLSEKVITIEGFLAREVRVDFQNGTAILKMRLCLVHNKLFVLETITETKKELNKSIDRFMNSFKLIK